MLNKKKVIVSLLIMIITFSAFMNDLSALTFSNALAVKFCQREEVANVIKMIKLLLDILRAVVPIILIIVAMIKLTGAITSGDGLDKVKKPLIANVVAAVLIFLIPTFVSLIMRITNTYDDMTECLKLTNNPIKTKPSEDMSGGGEEGGESTPSDNGAPMIKSITHKGSYVVVTAQKGTKGNIAGYYFSSTKKTPTGKEDNWVKKSTNKLELGVIPGNYYVYVKDNLNNISKPSTLTITWEDLYNDGTRSRDDANYPPINGEIDTVLQSKGDSLANLNDFIAWSVRSAGLFTKEGVATAGIALEAYLHAKYNIQVSYVCNIHCFGQRYNVEFGGNPKWGHVITYGNITSSYVDSKTGETIYPRQEAQSKGINAFCKGLYGGLDCQSFFGWSLHNAGFKAENTHGSYLGKNKAKEESCGSSCSKAKMETLLDTLVLSDEVINDSHVMLFLTHYDENKDGKNDGIYVYEAATRVGMKKWSYEELYRSKYFTINKMAGYYENSSNYACLLDKNGNRVSVPDAWKDKESLFRANCKATN